MAEMEWPDFDHERSFVVDNFKLGLLTFRAVVKGDNNVRTGALFECECGRYIVIPRNVIQGIKGYVDQGRVADLPWSCKKCDYTKPSTTGWRPWSPNRRNRDGEPAEEAKKAARPKHHHKVCNKVLHPKEWYCWQQLRRVSKGVCKRWESFDNFYADMGDAPLGGKLAKKTTGRKHGPANSYWTVPDKFTWRGQPVNRGWIIDELQIPGDYLDRCRKAKFMVVERILDRHRAGMPSPIKGEPIPPIPECPQHVG